jgi:hypothetical protein
MNAEMPSNTSDARPEAQGVRVDLVLRHAAEAIVLRKCGLVLVAGLLALLGVQAACVARLLGRPPVPLYVPSSTVLQAFTPEVRR